MVAQALVKRLFPSIHPNAEARILDRTTPCEAPFTTRCCDACAASLIRSSCPRCCCALSSMARRAPL